MLVGGGMKNQVGFERFEDLLHPVAVTDVAEDELCQEWRVVRQGFQFKVVQRRFSLVNQDQLPRGKPA